MDLGIIGNCTYSALIDRQGSVQWLCWPRFDSSFVFGGLLDKKKGGSFSISPSDGEAVEQKYLANTNVLVTEFETAKGVFKVTDFAPRFCQYGRHYKPAMLIRKVEPISGESSVIVQCKPTYDYGVRELVPTMGSNHISFNGTSQQLRLTTNASLNMVAEGRAFSLDKVYYFALTFGEPIEVDLEHTCETFLMRTVDYWRKWVKHTHLTVEYQKEVVRSALVLKLHQFEDTGAIVAASTTSIPEADKSGRNWDYRYCWLRDAMFTIKALRKLNHFEELEGFISFFRNIAGKIGEESERLQPVYGISGEENLVESVLSHLDGYLGNKPVRLGNQAYQHFQNDVYGEMILAMSPLFLDIRFQDGVTPDRISLLRKLMVQIENRLYQKDAGLWEFRGKEQLHCFTLLTYWLGATCVAKVGALYKLTELQEKAEHIQKLVKDLIEQKCFSSEIGAYIQAEGNDSMDASLLMLINFGFIDPNSETALKQIAAIEDQLKDESGLIRRYAQMDDFGKTTNCFTICNFWLAESYARCGKIDEAIELFEKLIGTSNHLDLHSEDVNPKDMQQWGNFPQTYSHVGLINAAFAIAEAKNSSKMVWM